MTDEQPTKVVETHSATLYFVGDRVYKAKKPVDLGFLDFRSREARERVCHDEVALNRRLAPDVYLGVADVRGPDGTWCEHLVVMRRLPEDRRLSTLLLRARPLEVELRRLAALLADFHERCEIPADAAGLGSAATARALWLDGVRVLREQGHGVVDAALADEIERLAARYLDGRADLLADRAAAGHVRDGHGDLLADDVFCLDDGPRVLDCLEFDRRLRVNDVLADVAFLAMDLERLGDPVAARTFLDAYAAVTGDRWPDSLEHHYVAYRALVRAKVSCVRAGQPGGEQAAGDARALAELARRHLLAGRVRLVLVGGLPGSGKSTAADRLAAATGWTLLSSDHVRKTLHGLMPTDAAPAGYRTGLYDAAATERTYAALFAQARETLARGVSVVVDASFTDPAHRSAAARLAEDAVADVVALELSAPPKVADRRLAARADAGSSASDATPEIRALMARTAPPWSGAVRISTEGPATETLAAVLEAVGVRQPPLYWTRVQ